jgi:hypothetical protein
MLLLVMFLSWRTRSFVREEVVRPVWKLRDLDLVEGVRRWKGVSGKVSIR